MIQLDERYCTIFSGLVSHETGKVNKNVSA